MFLATTCPEGWIRRGEFCYLTNKEKKTWKDASSDCKMKGGNLASIHNKGENDFIHQS